MDIQEYLTARIERLRKDYHETGLGEYLIRSRECRQVLTALQDMEKTKAETGKVADDGL